MKPHRISILVAGLLAAGPAVKGQVEPAAGPFADAIEIARQRVVKLYGGGLGREHGYGSGVLVSADGWIVTTLSVLLESPSLRAVLPGGRRFPARVIRRDESRQLALLQIDADDLPYFELHASEHLQPGDWLIAAANPFKVADGPEPISVAVGVFAGRAELSARRRRQDFVYAGPVLIADVIVATPGSAGGALVDAEGRLVGVIGKAVTSTLTNTWLNYALPVEQVAVFVLGTEKERVPDGPLLAPKQSEHPGEPDLGLRLFDVGGRTRPAYVERVRPDSPAQAAGIRPNDLILAIAGQPVATCDDFLAVRRTLRVGERVQLVIKRGDETKSVELTVRVRGE